MNLPAMFTHWTARACITAGGYHPLADVQGEAEVADYLADIAGVIAQCVEVMPAHAAFVAARRTTA